MTLVLTELSRHGIAMAADTALTLNTPSYDTRHSSPRVYHGAVKLQRVPTITAGISVCGAGKVGVVDADIWLREFVQREEENYTNLESFANLLMNELNRIIDPEPYAQMGFHLAGFAEDLPCFYHIHNKTNEHTFFASLDRPPRITQTIHTLLGTVTTFCTRSFLELSKTI